MLLKHFNSTLNGYSCSKLWYSFFFLMNKEQVAGPIFLECRHKQCLTVTPISVTLIPSLTLYVMEGKRVSSCRIDFLALCLKPKIYQQ